MKVYIVTEWTWYARNEWIINSIFLKYEDAAKRAKEIENCFREIEEHEAIE